MSIWRSHRCRSAPTGIRQHIKDNPVLSPTANNHQSHSNLHASDATLKHIPNAHRQVPGNKSTTLIPPTACFNVACGSRGDSDLGLGSRCGCSHPGCSAPLPPAPCRNSGQVGWSAASREDVVWFRAMLHMTSISSPRTERVGSPGCCVGTSLSIIRMMSGCYGESTSF
jgi:hypothetical protein